MERGEEIHPFFIWRRCGWTMVDIPCMGKLNPQMIGITWGVVWIEFGWESLESWVGKILSK